MNQPQYPGGHWPQGHGGYQQHNGQWQQPETSLAETPSRKPKKWLLIGALVLVVLLVAAIGGFYAYWNNGNRPNQKTADTQVPELIATLLEAERHGDSTAIVEITCRADHEKPDHAEYLKNIEDFGFSDSGYTDIDINEVKVKGDSARALGITRYKKETSGYEGYFRWEDGRWKGCSAAKDAFNSK